MRNLAYLCLVVLAACGGGGDNLPDAPPGGPDAPMQPDAGPGIATITVTQEDFDPTPGEPIAGADVAVFRPGGGGTPTLYTTDASGVAMFPVEPGAPVWVARDPAVPPTAFPGGPSFEGRIYYLASVSPGDSIRLGGPPRGNPGTSGTLTINYTEYGGGTYGGYHDAFLADCTDFGDTSVAGTLTFNTYPYSGQNRGCDGPGRALVLTATSPASGLPLAWLTVPDVATLPATIDATAQTWDAAGTTYTVNLSNHAADVTYAYAYYGSPASWHTFSSNGPVDTGTGTLTVTEATLTTPAIVTTELYHQLGSPQFVVEQTATVPSTVSVDGAALLPFISTPSYDEPTRTIQWTDETAGGVAPQLVTASFNYFDNVDGTQYRWTIYAPGTATELALPDVPDAIVSHDLRAGDLVYPDVWLIDVAGGSYSTVLSSIDLYRNDPRSAPFPGRALVSGGYGGGK
jgi:hypothetical protein